MGIAAEAFLKDYDGHRPGCLQLALASLSHERRTVLILRSVEGFDDQTIAEILNLLFPPNTSRSIMQAHTPKHGRVRWSLPQR